MKYETVAILTTKGGWFEPYARQLLGKIDALGYQTALFFDPGQVPDSYAIVFMLSVYQLVKKKDLARHKHNLVIHPSALPKGKGWAPLAWQVLEGKTEISIVLFEAVEEVDAGPIYLKDTIQLDGTELHDEIRQKQGEKLIEMSLRFLENYDTMVPIEQVGEDTFYPRRTPKDSEIDIQKTLASQINLLRICSNQEYPPFFYYMGKKYVLNVFKEDKSID